MIKRGILVIIFLLSLSLVQASLEINLSKTAYSPGEALKGLFSYSYSGAKDAGTPFILLVNSEGEERTFKDMLRDVGVSGTITPASYDEVAGETPTSQDFIFDDDGSEVNTGIKFEGIPNKGEFSINSISFDITGEENNGDYPFLPYLDFINDDINEWNYIGSLKDEWKDLNKNYLAVSDGTKQVILEPGKIYCEKVNLKPSIILPPSTNYDIRVRIKQNKGVDWASKPESTKLWGFIKGVSSGGDAPYKGECDSQKKECCVIVNPSQNANFEKKGCTNKINITVDESKDYFMCVYQTSDTKKYYTIDAENYAGEVEGWYAGKSTAKDGVGLKNNYDYYIWGKYRVYETNLASTVTITADSEVSKTVSNAIEEYIKECNTDDCIAPIKVGVKGAGKIILSNLNFVYDYGGSQAINNFVKITSTPETIAYDNTIKYSLNNKNLYAPQEEGAYTLNVVIGDESKEAGFSVVPIPIAVIYYEPWIVTTGVPVYFTAEESSAPLNKNLTKFEWNFGDSNTTVSGINATHSYKKVGDVTVNLKVTDESGFIGETSEVITVLSLNETLSDNLIASEELISAVKDSISSSEEYVKDTASLLNLNSIWDSALTQISLLKTRYNTALNTSESVREGELIKIYDELFALMDKIPQNIDVQSFTFPANIVSINEIPPASELKITGAGGDFEQAVLAFQEGINVQGDARIINLNYLSGKEETFMLIKKTISSGKSLSGGKIYELVQGGVVRNLTTPNYQIVSPDGIYSWSADNSVIVYILDESEASYGINTRTIIVPQLKDLKFEGGENEILVGGFECGDGTCGFDEDAISCPEDCKRHYPWTFIISLILIALIGIYYFNFHKGPYNFKEIGNLFKKKPKIFKSKEEKDKLFNFVRVSKERGLNENQIKFMLKNKGWNDAQINESIKGIQKPQKKVIKVGSNK